MKINAVFLFSDDDSDNHDADMVYRGQETPKFPKGTDDSPRAKKLK